MIMTSSHNKKCIEEQCIAKKMKMTEQRRIIARVLSESKDHPDGETIYKRACEIDPAISIATVYRTLRLLEDAEIIRKLDFADRARYEEFNHNNHDHLIDVVSGDITEFCHAKLDEIEKDIAKKYGVEIVGRRFDIYCKPIKK